MLTKPSASAAAVSSGSTSDCRRQRGGSDTASTRRLARLLANAEPDDVQWLLDAINLAVESGASIERSLGLPPKWRCRLRSEDDDDA